MLKKWLGLVLAVCLIFAPGTALAKGFGGRSFSGHSSYSSNFGGSSSKGFSYNSGSSSSHSYSSGLSGSSNRYSTSSRSYRSPIGASHFASFGLGMLLGSMFHPFGGYYGYGGMYGYHPFGFGHLILDIIILLIIIAVVRRVFRRR